MLGCYVGGAVDINAAFTLSSGYLVFFMHCGAHQPPLPPRPRLFAPSMQGSLSSKHTWHLASDSVCIPGAADNMDVSALFWDRDADCGMMFHPVLLLVLSSASVLLRRLCHAFDWVCARQVRKAHIYAHPGRRLRVWYGLLPLRVSTSAVLKSETLVATVLICQHLEVSVRQVLVTFPGRPPSRPACCGFPAVCYARTDVKMVGHTTVGQTCMPV